MNYLVITSGSLLQKKAKILYALLEISQDEFKELKLINRIRNNFAHSFKPDEDDIKDDAMKLKFHVFNEKREVMWKWFSILEFNSYHTLTKN